MLFRESMTAEQAGLFRAFCLECPGASHLQWESVEIDDLDGKRFLCLQAPWQEGQTEPIRLHFHPDGYDETEAMELTRRHGMEAWTALEEA